MKKITINNQATLNTAKATNLTEYAYITRFLEERTSVESVIAGFQARLANGEELTKAELNSLESKQLRLEAIDALLNADDILPFVEDCKEILASKNEADIRTLKTFANLYGSVHVPNCNTNKIYSAFLNYHSGEGTKKELQKALNAFLSVLRKPNNFVRPIIAKTNDKETDLFVSFILEGFGYDKKAGMVKINTMSQKKFNRNLFVYAVSQYQTAKVVIAETEKLTTEETKEIAEFKLTEETDEKIKNEKISLKNRYKKVEESKEVTPAKATSKKKEETKKEEKKTA